MHDAFCARPTRRGVLAGAAAAVATPLLPRPGWAASGFPDRPIDLVVAFPAGGGADVFGRIIAMEPTRFQHLIAEQCQLFLVSMPNPAPSTAALCDLLAALGAVMGLLSMTVLRARWGRPLWPRQTRRRV